MIVKDEKFYTWDELVEKFPDKWVSTAGGISDKTKALSVMSQQLKECVDVCNL